MNRSSLKPLARAAAVMAGSVPETRKPARPPTAVLTVRLDNLRSENGQVGCAVYSSAKGFPTDASAARQRLWCPIVTAASTCAFAPNPAGT